ncbi:hypothetical protein Clacol_008936 [Clathrus columnatus]|uniref:Uncharacterized protein n=1 Tax=Clathrus columnatus TaxID=1419009 RepID=A0AAV5AJV6_9AGAM|nr:hypothetical protein Clacol_008936 [Clathrus columnatus]
MKPRFPGRRRSSTEDSLKLLKKLFTDIPYMLTVVGFTLVYWGLFFPLLHGIDTNLAFYSITILNAASLLGRIIPNLIADFYGPMNIVGPTAICCGFLMFAMFAAGTIQGLVTFAILYGFVSGATLTLAGVTAFADDVSEVGFALLTGNPLMGALLDAPRYTWHRPIILSGVSIVIRLRIKDIYN